VIKITLSLDTPVGCAGGILNLSGYNEFVNDVNG
jgi:hypothetical protein